jgi:hypothetical protein
VCNACVIEQNIAIRVIEWRLKLLSCNYEIVWLAQLIQQALYSVVSHKQLAVMQGVWEFARTLLKMVL